MALIELHKIVKTFTMGDEKITAVNSINLSLNKKDFISIIGSSGSGKSTLMNIIGLLDRPDSGTYTINNVQTAGLNDNQLSKLRNQELGFIFQSFHLLPNANAIMNVAMPLMYASLYDPEMTREKSIYLATEALKRVGLSNRLDHVPNQLSGGQRQRVAIARSLVNSPSLLLADEPTGALDSKTGNDILKLFQELNDEGATIIIVTHDPKVAERTHNIYRMEDGFLKKES